MIFGVLVGCGPFAEPENIGPPCEPGVAIADTTPGDCQHPVCNATGNTISEPDNTDVPANTECATASCSNGTPSFTPGPEGNACGASMVCDATGVCVDCLLGAQCQSGQCNADHTCEPITCATHLLLSEIKTRGVDANDEFIELYNPGPQPVQLSSSITITMRSATGAVYSQVWQGMATEIVAVHGHYLIAGSTFSTINHDGVGIVGVSDNASVILGNGGMTIDAVCFTEPGVPIPTTGYTCEQTPIVRSNSTVNGDQSIQRKPGGPLGSCVDTDNSSADWIITMPPDPQNQASPLTPP